MIIYGQWAEKLVSLLHSRYGSELYKVICIHSHHRVWTAYHSQVDATGLLFSALEERLPETDLHAQWHALPPSFAVVTDQKLKRVDIWVTSGHTFLCLSQDVAHSSQNKDRSVPIKLRAFCNITLAYSVFLGKLSSGLFSVIGLFGNSDFLSLLAGFCNRTRRTYLATSTLRTPNTARESLLINRHTLQWWLPQNLGLGSYWIHLVLKRAYFETGSLSILAISVCNISLLWDANCSPVPFVQNVGLIGIQGGFLPRLFTARMYVDLKLLASGAMRDNVRREKSVCIRMTLSRERGSNACMGVSFD